MAEVKVVPLMKSGKFIKTIILTSETDTEIKGSPVLGTRLPAGTPSIAKAPGNVSMSYGIEETFPKSEGYTLGYVAPPHPQDAGRSRRGRMSRKASKKARRTRRR